MYKYRLGYKELIGCHCHLLKHICDLNELTIKATQYMDQFTKVHMIKLFLSFPFAIVLPASPVFSCNWLSDSFHNYYLFINSNLPGSNTKLCSAHPIPITTTRSRIILFKRSDRLLFTNNYTNCKAVQ